MPLLRNATSKGFMSTSITTCLEAHGVAVAVTETHGLEIPTSTLPSGREAGNIWPNTSVMQLSPLRDLVLLNPF